jgi:voltage-gated potassium channel Kch
MVAVSNYGLAIMDANEELQNDKEVVLAAIKNDGGAISYASDELKQELSNNREVVLSAVTSNGEALMDFDDAFRSDKEVVLAAVTHDESYSGDVFKSIDKKLQADREVILAAVKHASATIKYVSEELVDKEVILAITLENEYWDDDEVYLISEYVGDNAPSWKDKELNWQLIEAASEIILTPLGLCVINKSHPTLWKDKAFVIAMLENIYAVADEDYHPYAYMVRDAWYDWLDTKKFRQKLKNSPFIEDKEVMLQAWKLEYAIETECEFGLKDLLPDSLREDPEIILEAIKWNSASALAFADKSLLSNKEVVMAAVQEDGKALSSVDETGTCQQMQGQKHCSTLSLRG